MIIQYFKDGFCILVLVNTCPSPFNGARWFIFFLWSMYCTPARRKLIMHWISFQGLKSEEDKSKQQERCKGIVMFIRWRFNLTSKISLWSGNNNFCVGSFYKLRKATYNRISFLCSRWRRLIWRKGLGFYQRLYLHQFVWKLSALFSHNLHLHEQEFLHAKKDDQMKVWILPMVVFILFLACLTTGVLTSMIYHHHQES